MNASQLFLLCFASWLNRNQQLIIKYLQEEVEVLREQLGTKPRFNNDQRRRLAAKAKTLGRQRLDRFASIVTPQTLLDSYGRLIARKYDGSPRRSPGRPPTPDELRELILTMARQNRTLCRFHSVTSRSVDNEAACLVASIFAPHYPARAERAVFVGLAIAFGLGSSCRF